MLLPVAGWKESEEFQMSARPQLRSDVEIRELDERETLLYDPRSDAIHVLNSTAALIATLSDGQHTPEEMAAAIREQFEVDEDVDVLADVRTTLANFREQGLIDTSAD
jgi:PqqD family protein of HPr-rel-A system